MSFPEIAACQDVIFVFLALFGRTDGFTATGCGLGRAGTVTPLLDEPQSHWHLAGRMHSRACLGEHAATPSAEPGAAANPDSATEKSSDSVNAASSDDGGNEGVRLAQII